MNSRQCCCLVQIFIVLCGHLDHAANVNGQSFSSATPAPGATVVKESSTEAVTVDSSSLGTTEAVTVDSSSLGTTEAVTVDYSSLGTTEAVTVDSSSLGTTEAVTVDYSSLGTTEAVTVDSSSLGTTEAVTVDSSSLGTTEAVTVDYSSLGTTEAVTVDSSSLGTTEAVTVDSTLNSTLDSMAPTVVTEAPTVVTPEAPSATTISEGCLCDLTPDFCDIGCCCDTVDCGIVNLSTVFTGCPQKAISGVCIERWLMFRANVKSSLITVTDSLFCVRPEDDPPLCLPALPQYPALGNSYDFSPPAPTSSSHSRDFYMVDDVIQTYFSKSSVLGLLHQPSPGPSAAFCIDRNPAKFLRSVSLSCTRMLTPQSCTTDPHFNASSYFSDLSLIEIPLAKTENLTDFLVPVTPLSNWPAPSEQNNYCINVVKKVEFVVGYTDRGELAYATVNIVLADVAPNQLLLQTHSVQFQLVAPSTTPGVSIPTVGLRVGSPVIGRFDGEEKPLTVLGVSQGGECSSDPRRRAPILFTHNTITGCTFSSPSSNCSELRSQFLGILRGLAVPDVIAMNFGSQPDWTRVITQECPVSLQETSEFDCVLPNSLSIQVLWARQGLVDLPQSYILGAKYLFQCQQFKSPTSSPIALTTEVTFVDTTLYPEPPRGSPQPDWKFPFGFFTRGAAELDGHIVINCGVNEKVTWSLMLFTVMLLTGLEFFTR